MSGDVIEANTSMIRKHSDTAPAAAAEASSIIAIIERAARDATVDIDKMERLMGMFERQQQRQAEAEYNAALAEAQCELPTICERGGIKDRSGNIQSRYALWEDINEAIKPVLQRHGFALTFRTGQDGGAISVTGVLSHRGGHREQTTLTLPSDTSGSKNAVQAVGSSTSYGKRYTAGALLNITTGGEDDDGVAGGGDPGVRSQGRSNHGRALLPDYPKAAFNKNLPAWRAAIESGKRTAQQIIDMVSTKGALADWMRDEILAVGVPQVPGDDFDAAHDAAMERQ